MIAPGGTFLGQILKVSGDLLLSPASHVGQYAVSHCVPKMDYFTGSSTRLRSALRRLRARHDGGFGRGQQPK